MMDKRNDVPEAGDGVLQLLAELLDDQARVARAEAALAAAKKRMALSEQRLGRLRAGRGAEVREGAPAAAVTLRTRIVEATAYRPNTKMFTASAS